MPSAKTLLRLNLKTSSQRYFSTFSAKTFLPIFPLSFFTNQTPRRLSSVLASPLSVVPIFLLICSQNSPQETPVSAMSAFFWVSFAVSLPNSLRMSSMSNRRWKALSNVNTFWSLVFIVA